MDMFIWGFVTGVLVFPVLTVVAFSILGWDQIAERFNDAQLEDINGDH